MLYCLQSEHLTRGLYANTTLLPTVKLNQAICSLKQLHPNNQTLSPKQEFQTADTKHDSGYQVQGPWKENITNLQKREERYQHKTMPLQHEIILQNTWNLEKKKSQPQKSKIRASKQTMKPNQWRNQYKIISMDKLSINNIQFSNWIKDLESRFVNGKEKIFCQLRIVLQ